MSAYGQTALHDRMGLDHRDALDVAVHPDSPEGRALMEYLREAGIPFIAAWGVVPAQRRAPTFTWGSRRRASP